MRNGLRVAVKVGFNNIHIKGDNKILIQTVQGRIQSHWKIQVLIQDIFYYLQTGTRVIVHHIFRKGNRAADWLAELGLSLSSTIVWTQVSHREFHYILNENNLGYNHCISHISYKKNKIKI